jgi:hypothetical protein
VDYRIESSDRIFYGLIHQTGAKGTGFLEKGRKSSEVGRTISLRAHIPERPMFLIQDEDADKIEEVFIDWVAERARRAGIFGKVGIGTTSLRELIS